MYENGFNPRRKDYLNNQKRSAGDLYVLVMDDHVPHLDAADVGSDVSLIQQVTGGKPGRQPHASPGARRGIN